MEVTIMPDIYYELCDRILRAQEEMLKHEVEANTVILNGKKYGAIFKSGYRPSIFGMAAECESLPDDWDFIVQYREPKISTNADRLRAMSDEELAKFFPCTASEFSCHPGATNEDCKKVGGWWHGCPQCWLQWLQSPAGGEQNG
jgi:hypothetical protein